MYDSFLLMPTNPSMLQARDAQLAADLMRFGGANQKELWHSFAESGFGVGATSTNGSVNTDTDPTPSFASQLEDNATITFRAETKDHAVIPNARFFVGHYEARVSPIADTESGDDGSEPRRHGAVRAGDVRARRDGTGLRPPSRQARLPQGRDEDRRVRVHTELRVGCRRSDGDTVTARPPPSPT